jgi:membrane protease subunit (stomatin/prohibitin family)
MTGNQLIEKIKETNLCDCEVFVNFTHKGNAGHVVEIKNVSVECTDMSLFIDVGKIDDIIEE